MKYFLIALTFLTFASGCSRQNAFSKFDMSKEQELLESNSQSSKLESKDGVEGVFTIVYLNNAYKDEYKEVEAFLVSIYVKDLKRNFTLSLNGQDPLSVQKLLKSNKFAKISKSENSWRERYLFTFKKDDNDLDLILRSGDSSSTKLTFVKN